MMSASLATAWLQLLALLAAEVGLIALGVALLRSWCPTAAWRRTFCQAGIIAVLVVTLCELSGSARALGGWAASVLAPRTHVNLSAPESQAASEASPGIDLSPLTPSVPMNRPLAGRLARQLPARRALDLPTLSGTPTPTLHPSTSVAPYQPTNGKASAPPAPMLLRQTISGNLADTAARPLDSVSDSMAVLWLCLLWLTGAALAGGRACLAHCLFMIFRLRRRPVTAPALAEEIRALARSLGIARRVRVIESARLTCPIAFGLVRPTVGLPPGFAVRFDPAKQEAMLAHELAHLAAHDPFWCLLADVATVVLWWHPGVWWLRRQLHLASEMAADEASLLVADGPHVLAECLVELGARLTGPVLGQLRVSGFRSHLGQRVQQLVHLEGRAWSPLPRLGATMMRILGPMAMTVIVVFCTAWAAPRALTKGDSMKIMQLNWKRSLATLALLGAFNGPEPGVALAQSTPPAPPPTPAPEVAPAPPASPAEPAAASKPSEAPAPNQPPSTSAIVSDPFRGGDGLRRQPPAADNDANAARAEDAFRERYGLRMAPRPPRQPLQPARGSKIEAKLKKIVLPEIIFDGLPLGEVLKILSEDCGKLDPDQTGVNFLINPNVPPVARPMMVDPTTGLPVAAPAEQFDLASVNVKFNLPLRKVTMKDVLDAIVLVADHPIQYTLEDYAVVFSAKPEAVAVPALLTRPEAVPAPPQPGSPTPNPFMPTPRALPMLPVPTRPPGPKQESYSKPPAPAAELAEVKPKPFNVDFGPSTPSEQVGPAAVGHADDFWNIVAAPSNDHHTASDLKFVEGDPSPIEVEMINLGGGWSCGGTMGVKSPMLNTYNYPTGNRGGDSTVILHQVPPGKYAVYIYGHGPVPLYYGDYGLIVGTHDYGRKQTSNKEDAIRNTKWIEGSQYVKFSDVKVGDGDDFEVLIRPGAEVTDPMGRTFADAMICGLQLVPAK